jgi:response regulator of citrate/malate metabolism
MILPTTINPRLLIVEDQPRQLKLMKNQVGKIPAEKLKLFGVAEFDIDLAQTVTEAERCFAHRNGSSYDLMLLDLGIPKKAIGEPTPPDNGQGLLEKVQKIHGSKEVIVVSVWSDLTNVAAAYRSGVIDFIPKPYTAKTLQTRILEGWKRLLSKESARLLGEDRIRHLVPYAEKGLAHRFSTCFSNLIRAASHTAEDVERYMRERHNLNRRKDPHDYFFECLNSQEEAMTKTKQEWVMLNAAFQPNESSQVIAVEELVKSIHQQLLPCLIVKNITLDFMDRRSHEVLTFENDVRAVLQELIAGAASALPDFGAKAPTVEIKVTNHDGQVKVSFRDRLNRIPTKTAEEINLGSSISPLPRFGREWGLSVMQHIAMHGGGRLHIEPRADGNIINYFIPTAQ